MSHSYLTINKNNCTICAHYEVCSKKETYKKAQEAVDRVSVTLGESSDGIVTMDLRNIDWIKSVVLECSHFLTQPVNIRAGSDSSEESKRSRGCMATGEKYFGG